MNIPNINGPTAALGNIKRIHFVGIGGTGMSGIGREPVDTGCIGPLPRSRSCARAVRTSEADGNWPSRQT